MKDYKKLTPFKLCVLQNFPFIEEDFDALTNYELMCKIVEYLNKTINSQNMVVSNIEALNNWFNNLNVQDEINNKLDAMAESGQLAEIIAQYINLHGVLAYNTIDELKNATNIVDGSICKTLGESVYNDGKGSYFKIRTITSSDVVDNIKIFSLNISNTLIAEKIDNYYDKKVDELSRNNRYVAYIFCDNEYRQTIAYVTELLERSANAGFKESQMTIHINNDGTLVEDKAKFIQYNDIANKLNIPIKSVKFHGNYSATNYESVIIDCLNYFPDCEVVFVFNEQSQHIYQHGLSLPTLIKTAFSNVKKVGFTFAYNQAFVNNNITNSQMNSISEAYDLIGVHMYPSCSTYVDSANCTYERVLNAFNEPSFLLNWNKEIWLTESGVLPYWQMMELPENYDYSVLTDRTRTCEPQYLFFRALNNCNFAQRCKKIVPWYLESGMSDPKHELFDILHDIMLGR